MSEDAPGGAAGVCEARAATPPAGAAPLHRRRRRHRGLDGRARPGEEPGGGRGAGTGERGSGLRGRLAPAAGVWAGGRAGGRPGGGGSAPWPCRGLRAREERCGGAPLGRHSGYSRRSGPRPAPRRFAGPPAPGGDLVTELGRQRCIVGALAAAGARRGRSLPGPRSSGLAAAGPASPPAPRPEGQRPPWRGDRCRTDFQESKIFPSPG